MTPLPCDVADADADRAGQHLFEDDLDLLLDGLEVVHILRRRLLQNGEGILGRGCRLDVRGQRRRYGQPAGEEGQCQRRQPFTGWIFSAHCHHAISLGVNDPGEKVSPLAGAGGMRVHRTDLAITNLPKSLLHCQENLGPKHLIFSRGGGTFPTCRAGDGTLETCRHGTRPVQAE